MSPSSKEIEMHECVVYNRNCARLVFDTGRQLLRHPASRGQLQRHPGCLETADE